MVRIPNIPIPDNVFERYNYFVMINEDGYMDDYTGIYHGEKYSVGEINDVIQAVIVDLSGLIKYFTNTGIKWPDDFRSIIDGIANFKGILIKKNDEGLSEVKHMGEWIDSFDRFLIKRENKQCQRVEKKIS